MGVDFATLSVGFATLSVDFATLSVDFTTLSIDFATLTSGRRPRADPDLHSLLVPPELSPVFVFCFFQGRLMRNHTF